MVHPKRVHHVPRVAGQQCRGLRTSRKWRLSNRVWRYQRNTTTRSSPSLRLRLTLRSYIICVKIICHNILWHLLILCLVLRLIKHYLILHPIISNKTLICIPGIIMRWCRINHLGGVIHLRLWALSNYPRVPGLPSIWDIRILIHLFSLSASRTRRSTFAHHILCNKSLLLILIPSHICTKQIKNNINTWTMYLGISKERRGIQI